MMDLHWGMKPHRPKAIMLIKRQLAEFVCDSVNLEGLHFTLPEIQTLLEGITVGGHKISDQRIALNPAEAWRMLIKWLERDAFDISPEKACALHAVAGREEALEWGRFRSGGVTIAGTEHMPPAAASLPVLFMEMVEKAHEPPDIYDQAIHLFLTMARNQFFYDVNKRMGRFMMNGHLLNNGFPAINVPAGRQLEFNELMIAFYESEDQAPMNRFLRSCLDDRTIHIMKEIQSPP